jgi:hypothetical protein
MLAAIARAVTDNIQRERDKPRQGVVARLLAFKLPFMVSVLALTLLVLALALLAVTLLVSVLALLAVLLVLALTLLVAALAR